MDTSRYKPRSFSKRAEEELERRLAETPEEAWERFCAVTGFEPVEEEETGAWEDDPEDTDPLGPPAYFEDLPRRPIRYRKEPTTPVSLSTRKGQGQRAQLAYSPRKEHRYPIDGLGGPKGHEFSPRMKARRAKLPTPRSARFSKTVDLDWNGGGVMGHRQLSVFLGDLSGYDNVLGFSLLQRRQQHTEKSEARKRRPLLYQQTAVPFYYLMESHKDVFHRSWSHAMRAANVVKAKRQSLVWPDVLWWDKVDGNAMRNSVELCRTPISSVKVHYEDGTAKHSIPHNEDYPTAYEVVELVCEPASPEVLLIESDGKKPKTVKNRSRYKGAPRFFLRFKRVAYDEHGEELPVSFLGYTRGLTLPVETVLRLGEVLPTWLDEVRSYFAENPSQVDRAPYYQTHPNPLLHRWGFFVCDELKYGASNLDLTFTKEREEAYLTDKALFEGDCPRYRDDGTHGTALSNLHPLYVSRLAAMAAGELLWRSQWAVDEPQAYEDLRRLHRFTEMATAASVFIYAFCPALVQVFLNKTQMHRFITKATRVRQSVDGTTLIKLRFCRGPPPHL